jgi:membrane associated rhomboid family serine protease
MIGSPHTAKLIRGDRTKREEGVFPYHDENQTQRTAFVTLIIIALNVAAWILIQGAGQPQAMAASVCDLGLIPGELTGMVPPGSRFVIAEGVVCVTRPGPQLGNIVTSMFLHGGWLHLLGNMWFLWLFGNNIEDSMTRPRFIAFYLLCGVAAALLQVAVRPDSTVPMVGASGAISGVMGAYLILYPRVKVYAIIFLGFFITSIALPAWVMLLYWAFIQLVGGFARIGAEGGGVAFWAHIGGFLAGVVLIKLFAIRDRISHHSTHHWRPRRVGW